MTMAEVPVSPSGRFHESIQQLVSRQQYELWFKSLQVISMDDSLVRLSVANEFVSEWLSSYYSDVIREAIEKGLEAEPAFELVVAHIAPPVAAPEARPTAPPTGPSRHDTTESNHRFFLQHSDVVLNSKYIFDNFVAGPSNQLAHAAAMAVADAPAGSYNPLFLHGAVGLGKTHLLQAICHKAMDWVRLRPWRSAMRTPKSLQTTSRMRSMPVVEGPRSPSRKPRARRARFRSMCWLISWA